MSGDERDDGRPPFVPYGYERKPAITAVVVVIAAIVAIMGLVLVATALLFVNAMSSYGSNK